MSLRLGQHEIGAVIFDFDGVLADTAAGWARAEEALCALYSVAYTAELAAGTHGVSVEDAVTVLTADASGPVCPEAAAARLRQLAEQHVLADSSALDGAADALERIGAVVPVAVASNSERPLLELVLDATGLAPLVDVVVSASDVPRPKPAPDIYLHAARRVGVAPGDALVVEDSPTGAAAAAAAGCVVAHFAPEAALGPAPARRPATTVRGHLDLLAQLGLLDDVPQ
jgi:HAD superfamily hydrolase (TIGR01509 family)